MKLPIVSRDPQTVLVNYMNQICPIPMTATDLKRANSTRSESEVFALMKGSDLIFFSIMPLGRLNPPPLQKSA